MAVDEFRKLAKQTQPADITASLAASLRPSLYHGLLPHSISQPAASAAPSISWPAAPNLTHQFASGCMGKTSMVANAALQS